MLDERLLQSSHAINLGSANFWRDRIQCRSSGRSGRSGQVRGDLKRQTNLGARPTPSSRSTYDSVGFLRRRTANGSRLCSLSRHSSRKGTIFKIASDTARSRQMIRKQSRTPNQSANPPSAPIGVDVKVVSFFPDSSYADNTRRREMTPLFRPV